MLYILCVLQLEIHPFRIKNVILLIKLVLRNKTTINYYGIIKLKVHIFLLFQDEIKEKTIRFN